MSGAPSISRWSYSLALVAGLGLSACPEPSSQDCIPGNPLCFCAAQGQCVAGYVCVAGYCVDPGSSSNGDAETGGDGDGDGNGDGDGDACEPGKTFCDVKCVDTQSHPLHCGGCGMPCLDGEVCADGSCVFIEDCLENGCPGFSYCDPNSDTCMPGCDSDAQCEPQEACNLGTHDCECAAGYKLCANVCIPDAEPCEELCGNGVLDEGEVCDGAQLGNLDCTDLGHDAGTLGCAANCNDFNTSQCIDYGCGNGVLDPGEVCDDGNLVDGDGCSADCSCPSELLAEFEGWTYYTVETEGPMIDPNTLAACEGCGLEVPCGGPAGCYYVDDVCQQTGLVDYCGDLFIDLADFLCGTSAGQCPELQGVYQYMGSLWNGDHSCGIEGSSYCSDGGNYVNRKALCVEL